MRFAVRRWLAGLIVAAVVLGLSWDRVLALLGPERIVLAQALATGLLQGGVYALSAMGLTLIFGVLGIINFGHGALVSVGLYLCWSMAAGFGIDPYLSLLFVTAATFLIGMLLYRALLAPSLNQPHENQLLLTLAVAIVIENGLKLGFSATPRFVQSSLTAADLRILGLSTPAAWVIAFAGSVAVAGLLHLLLTRTLLGASIRAVASNRTGAMLVGIDVGRIYTLVFGLGAACVGATAVLVAPVVPIEPVAGERFTIVAFVVVVLGGLGNIAGAFIGGLLVGFAQELGGVLFPSQSKLLAVFIVFLCVLFLRPQGLLGKAR